MSARTLYRGLLRELPPRPLLNPARSPLHSRIRADFSTPRAEDPALAEQAVAYLHAQRTYAMLLERYNPGMGIDEAERVRLSARRVGMNLPKSAADESEE